MKKILIFALILFSALICAGCDRTDAPDPELAGTLTVVNNPVRSLYVAGETFDPTGILLCLTKEGVGTLTTECSFDTGTLAAGCERVSVSCGGLQVDVPVTVIPGAAIAFPEPSYTQRQYDDKIEELTNANKTIEGIDIGLQYNGQHLINLLPDPHPTGVSSFEELLEEIDYHLFYGLDSMVIKTAYNFGSLDETLDRVYFESGFAGACMSLEGQALDGGYIQIVVKYYGNELISVEPSDELPTVIDFRNKESSRPDNYQYELIDKEGVYVYNSEQAIYALSKGLKIYPVQGSPAEEILRTAQSILNECCDDSMSPFEKMYNIYCYLATHATYDVTGEEWAGHPLDIKRESDMFSARLISFRAEGPLLYGNTACYGNAKAATLLLALEGFDVTRVVAVYDEEIKGRSQISVLYDEGLAVHSYSYVRIDGSDYLFDVTYSFAGTPAFSGVNCVFFRDFCVGLSKDDHRQIYQSIKDDAYTQRSDYNPGSYNVWDNLLYDGTNDCLLEGNSEIEACLRAVASKMSESKNYYSFSFAWKYETGVALNTFRDETTALAQRILPPCHWFRYANSYTINGETYYAFFMLVHVE